MMIKIKTKDDLAQLKLCPEISPAYYQLVEKYFFQLTEPFCSPELVPYFYDPENEGYIVVLESRDDPHRLGEVGLPDGIALSFYGPEWSEYHELSDGTCVYQVAYLLTNDFIMIYYMDAELWPDDPVMQDFFEGQRFDSTKECDF